MRERARGRMFVVTGLTANGIRVYATKDSGWYHDPRDRTIRTFKTFGAAQKLAKAVGAGVVLLA